MCLVILPGPHEFQGRWIPYDTALSAHTIYSSHGLIREQVATRGWYIRNESCPVCGGSIYRRLIRF